LDSYKIYLEKIQREQAKLSSGKVINPACFLDLLSKRMESLYLQKKKKTLEEYVAVFRPGYKREAMQRIESNPRYLEYQDFVSQSWRFLGARISIKKKVEVNALPKFLSLERGDKGHLLDMVFFDLAPDWIQEGIKAFQGKKAAEVKGEIVFLEEDMFRILKK